MVSDYGGKLISSSIHLRTGYALSGLVILHFCVVALFAFEVIPQEYHPPDRMFWFHNGGDNVEYFALARGMVSGELPVSKYPLGFPLTMIPFVLVFQPTTYDQILEPVAIFWSLVMFPIGQIALYYLTKMMTGRRITGLISVLIWTLLPLLIYAPLRIASNSVVAETYSVHLIWAQMLSDGPTTLLTIFAFIVYFKWHKLAYKTPGWEILLGILLGALVLVRYTGAITGILIAMLLLGGRRWRALFLTGFSAFVVVLPQLIYNLTYFGNPISTGYTVLDILPEYGLFHPNYLIEALGAALARSPVLVLAGITATVLVTCAGLWLLWRQSRLIGSYVAIYAIYYYSWIGGLTRFLIPAYPAMAILLATVLVASYRAIVPTRREMAATA